MAAICLATLALSLSALSCSRSYLDSSSAGSTNAGPAPRHPGTTPTHTPTHTHIHTHTQSSLQLSKTKTKADTKRVFAELLRRRCDVRARHQTHGVGALLNAASRRIDESRPKVTESTPRQHLAQPTVAAVSPLTPRRRPQHRCTLTNYFSPLPQNSNTLFNAGKQSNESSARTTHRLRTPQSRRVQVRRFRVEALLSHLRWFGS